MVLVSKRLRRRAAHTPSATATSSASARWARVLLPGTVLAGTAALGTPPEQAHAQVTFAEQTGADNPFNGIDLGDPSYPSPTLADLDGDGDLDALVGENNGTIHYFENTGSVTSAAFTEQTGAANPFDGINVESYSAPALADLDGDGDFDALVGENNGTIHYFENTGSVTSAAFTEQTGAANPFDGIDAGTMSAPTLADLDGDGDLDAIVGDFDGTIHYFENTGTATSPTFEERTGAANPFDGIDINYYSGPVLADVDGDGDLDALSGESYGTIHYFENTGSATSPTFEERTGAANPFDGIDVEHTSTPVLADVDGDGDLDALVGERYGTFKYFENTTASAGPEPFAVAGTNPFASLDVGYNSTPTLGDLDGDGDLDALVGDNVGPIHYFENTGTATSPTFTQRTGGANPFNGLSSVGSRSAPTLADLDADGALDALVGDNNGTLITYQQGEDHLPVELTRFAATLDGTSALLAWHTASETANAGFEVQHLLDPTLGSYTVLGFVEGAGTTTEATTYRFRTDALAPGTHYFRLKQLDFDGAVAYSPLVEVQVGAGAGAQVSALWPNPAAGAAYVDVVPGRPQPVRVVVYDVLGREVATVLERVLEGPARVELDGAWSPGLYVVRIEGESFSAERLLTRLE